MSKNYWIAFAGVALIAAGLVWYLAVPDEEGERPTLANPASVHCERDLGGTLEIVEGQGGQQGLCHLPDGRVCEEWALYQSGACMTGEGTPVATSTLPAPRPATTTPSGSDTAAMNAARAQASTDFGVVESAVTIVSATPHDWPDSCLGLPAPDEMCSQVVTAGYEVTVSVNGARHVYRTNLDGSFLRKAS